MIQRIISKTRLFSDAQKLLLLTIAFGLAAIFAFSACQGESNDDTEQSLSDLAGQTIPLTALSETEAMDARDRVLSYLSEKSWGFFGATCDKWVDLDYEFSADDSGKALNDVIRVVFNRQPDRDLGSLTLSFEVREDGSVQGDNLLERSGIAEGCDQW
ncbi:MAG: hypothetical protein HOF01_03690 [Chloroflexi bacterium]|jgi:hypothetical protein|nr:hypothetical protein [Chloroflexota bacterium]